MAPRPPRTNPQPPNRGRRKASARVPSVGEMAVSDRATAYERHVLTNRASQARQVSRAVDSQSAVPARERALRNIDYETALAIQAAKEGDDSLLLPYQPTPSINPPRPRTVAAGYDRRTRTLRVRFRDGTPWEYYEVPPNVWRNFTRVKSPGRFVNRVLNNYEYARGNF